MFIGGGQPLNFGQPQQIIMSPQLPLQYPQASPLFRPAQTVLSPMQASISQLGGGSVQAQGGFVDHSFPPTNDSIFRSPTPQQDHIQDILGHTNGGQVQWKRVGSFCNKLFDHIHPNDIAQGILGDCWLLAGMAGIAEFKNRISDLFQEDDLSPNGEYHIKIFDMNTRQWNWVTIDDFIPMDVQGKPIFSKPHGNEAWVLLLEKAVAKWFGSYLRLQGAFAMVPFMILTDLGQVKCYSQRQIGPNMYAPGVLDVKLACLRDAHDRNSVGFQPLGTCGIDQAFQELKQADDAECLMAAWTTKDPPSQAGVGASGEAIGSDGIVKGHAYSLTCADFFQADNGEVWRIVQLRNPWGANPSSEWNGELSDHWPGWAMHPKLRKQLHIDHAGSDGLFYMRFETFLERFSDFGVMGGSAWREGKSATSETPLKSGGSQLGMIQKNFRKPGKSAFFQSPQNYAPVTTVQQPFQPMVSVRNFAPVTTVQQPLQPVLAQNFAPVTTVQQPLQMIVGQQTGGCAVVSGGCLPASSQVRTYQMQY